MNSIPAEALSRIPAWHRENRRPLPWRDSPTPYHVWISEIMLQQTRIEAVIPYYLRFIAAFPDVYALAGAQDDFLMKHWEGLGYYSRARNLKKAAIVIVEQHGGKLPCSFDGLRALPGIGDYTAGAIASLAFGLPEPAVDGNVLRTIMRLTACGDDISAASTKKSVTQALRPFYPSGEEARFLTEGLMALGQMICTPVSPACDKCPVCAQCLALKEGKPEKYPHKSPKKARRIEEIAVFLLRRGDLYALRRRPHDGMLADMWEFPNCPLSACPPLPDNAVPLGLAKHIFTHVEWHMTGWEIDLDDSTALPSDFVWEKADVIRGNYAVPSAFRAWSDQMTDTE